MHPQLLTFLKLTGLVAAAIVVFFLLTSVTGWLIKVALVAALIAAVAMGGFFVYNYISRRRQLPVIR
jgi:hypothetical protein